MDIQTILNLFARRWRLVALTAVLAAIFALGFSILQPDRYRATVDIMVLSRPDYGQTQATRSLLHTYAARFLSTQRMQYAIDELQLDMKAGSLLRYVKAGVGANTNIITVSVETGDPEVAKAIARVLAEEFIQWRDEDNANFPPEDFIRAELLDDPQVVRLNRPLINTAAGFILGIIVGVLIAAALELVGSGFIRNARE